MRSSLDKINPPIGNAYDGGGFAYSKGGERVVYMAGKVGSGLLQALITKVEELNLALEKRASRNTSNYGATLKGFCTSISWRESPGVLV